MVQLDNNKIYAINNVGVVLRIKLKEQLNIAEATSNFVICWRDPLGNTSIITEEEDTSWQATLDIDRQHIFYVLKNGDITIPGIWTLYVLMVNTEIRLRSYTIELMVYDEFD